jgi:ribose 5-phosphate isomerase RpiB
VLGSEFVNPREAADIAREFLTTAFSGAERHLRRLGKIRYFERHARDASAKGP